MMRPADLERLADRGLRDLPLPRAPQTLLPLVMAAVQEWALRPWYTRAWFTWPRGWQIAALAALALLAAGSAVLLPGAGRAAMWTVAPFAGPASELATVREYVRVAAEVGRILWRTVLAPLTGYAFAVVLLMCLACAVFGTALNHVVAGRMSEQ